jgi:CheY-like chemotaxis protein
MPELQGDGVRVICYPADTAFEAGVRAAFDNAGGSADRNLHDTERKLHESYPDLRIVVHAPHEAGLKTHQATWVVFRDRHVRRRREQPQRHPVALVVDDEPLVLLLICAVLTSRGWHVLSATNGATALANAQDIDVDLLVTDYNMPGIDGGTLARRLSDHDCGLPVLMVSGQPERIERVEGTTQAFLGKPFTVGDLAARVQSLTGYPAA